MKTISFKNCKELACAMVERYKDINGKFELSDVTVVAMYEEAREILAQLIKFGYGIKSIEIEDEECDGYCDEFLISLCDGEIWCEKCKTENGYLYNEANVTYLIDNCNSKIIPYIRSKEIYEVSLLCADDTFFADMYGRPDNDDIYWRSEKKSHIKDTHAPEVKVEKDEDDDVHGFTITQSDDYGYSSVSFYSTDELNKESVKKIIDRFDL